MAQRPAPLGPKLLVVTDPARADIDDVIDHIAQEADDDTAMRFLDRIDAELARLAWLGHSGVSREWLKPGLRLTVMGNYCIYFRVTPTETVILRFVHGARDLGGIDFEPKDT